MVVSNPRVYTTDSYNYQFIWDDCSNVDEEYNLFIYKLTGTGPNPTFTCVNPDSPIIISYNEKVSLAKMENYSDQHSLNTPIPCKFEISNSSNASHDVANNCFPSGAAAMLRAVQAGNICNSLGSGQYSVVYGAGARECLQNTVSPIDHYEIWYTTANQGDNSIDWKILQTVNGPVFEYTKDSPLEKNTDYKGQIIYKRKYGNVENYTLATTNSDNSEIEIVVEKQNTWECTPIEWNADNEDSNKSIILDITNDNLLYINSEIETTDIWNINLGNSIDNGHVVVDASNQALTKATYNIGNYNYLEYSVNTNAEQPSGEYTKSINTTTYKKPESWVRDYHSIFNFTTNTGYAHDATVFAGNYNCNNYVHNGDNYEYQGYYTKNFSSASDIYIYQQNGSNYDLMSSNSSNSEQQYFKLIDPDKSNDYTYNVICSDVPVKDDGGNIIQTDIQQEQLDEVIYGLSSDRRNKVSLYEIANYKISHSIGSFKEYFIWDKMYIEYDSTNDAPKLFVQGNRANEESMKCSLNTYQVIIQNLIDDKFNLTFDLEKNSDTDKWELTNDGGNSFYGTDGYSLKELQDAELGPRNQYKILIKAFSTNKKRNSILQTEYLEYKDSKNSFMNLFKCYYPENTVKKIKEENIMLFNISYLYSREIDVRDCSSISISPSKNLTEKTYYWRIELGQKQKDTEDIFYYTENSFNIDKTYGCDNIDVKEYDKIKLTYVSHVIEDFYFAYKKIFDDFPDGYANQPNKNFGFCIEKDSYFSTTNGTPSILYNNNLDSGKISYFNYSANAINNNDVNDKGLHNYNYEDCGVLSKISIFPQNTKAVSNIDDEKIFLDFSVEEMEQKNFITSNDSPLFSSEDTITTNSYDGTNDKKTILFKVTGQMTEEFAPPTILKVDFEKDVIVNSIKNLGVQHARLVIKKDLNGEILYDGIQTSTTPVPIVFNNKYIKTSKLYFVLYRINFTDINLGMLYSSSLQIITLEKAEGAEGKGKRNRTFKTENIDLYISNSSNNTIDYSIVNNGEILTGRVLDNNKPVNFYIESFADLNNDENGDLIYKIEKVQETYDYLTLPAEDNNTVIITQQNKNNEEEFFDKEFYINSDTNKLKITNTNTNKITFTQNQTDTIVNCVLEKKEIDS